VQEIFEENGSKILYGAITWTPMLVNDNLEAANERKTKFSDLMTESCCCPSEAGNTACELRAQDFERPDRDMNVCPECDKTGKPVQGQTVKSLLSVSLRQAQDKKYLFLLRQKVARPLWKKLIWG